MGKNVNGKFLNHLRFADDIILIATDLDQLQTMMNQLHQVSSKIGLKMNLSKTKIMTIPKSKNIQSQWDNINLARIISNNFKFDSNLDMARFKASQHKESG